MNARWLIVVAALSMASCRADSYPALVITKVVLGTATTDPGPPAVTTCSYDQGADEFSYAHIDPTANTGGTVGVVVDNKLVSQVTQNPQFRTDTTAFHPHQVVADYEVVDGSQSIMGQIIPVSGTIPGGGTGAVLVPFFAPIQTSTLSGMVRVTFHVEGKLDDGSKARTGNHEYIFVTCSGAGCNSPCL